MKKNIDMLDLKIRFNDAMMRELGLDITENDYVYDMDTESILQIKGKFIKYCDYEYPILKYNEEIELNLIENPRQKHLQKIGWNPEDKQSKPIICYLTYKDSDGHDIYPSEGAILEVSARQTPHDMQYIANKFDIVAAKVDFEMNMFICNLVPHREYAQPVNETETSQDPINENKWFKRDIIYPEDKRTE